MNTVKVNEVLFKGQYADALQELQSGKEITMSSFKNGNWEPTSKMRHFIALLMRAGINYNQAGYSLRQTVLSAA